MLVEYKWWEYDAQDSYSYFMHGIFERGIHNLFYICIFLLYTIIIKEVIFARKKKIFTVCYNCNTLQASSPYLICAL